MSPPRTAGRLEPVTTALVATVAVLWGAPYLLIRVAVDEVAPVVVVAVRCAIAALLLVPLAAGTGGFRRLRRRHLPWILLLGVLEFALPFTLITVGEQHVSSALTGVIVASAPLFVAALAPLVDRSESASGRRLLGLGIGFVGVVGVLGLDVADSSIGSGLLIALAALSYAVTGFVLKLRLGDAPPLAIVASATAVAVLLTAVPAARSAPTTLPSAAALVSLGLLGVGCTAVAFTLFVVLNTRVGPGRSAVVAYLAPGVAVLLGVLVLDESLGGATIVGLVLILLGSRLVVSSPNPVKEGAPS